MGTLEPRAPNARIATSPDSEEAARVLEQLAAFGPVLSVKLYRVSVEATLAVPSLPCLDHEAMLHEGIAPHVAAYLQDASSGDISEVVCVPARRRLEVDSVSTWGECSPDSHARLLRALAERLPDYTIRVRGPSWWRGERRVAAVCRAQVALRDVLLDPDLTAVKAAVERLQTIGAFMEKQSRVASWGVRTMTGPLLAATGVVLYALFGVLSLRVGENVVTGMRYGVIGLLGAIFLYYGLKAVQLTDMANRVWKRTAEYSLILSERKRLGGR